ncbi:Protein MON2 -like protein [Trametes pubescens]|uniref:Protein MON2-like protein n=1 Tax=Trametes pubescens TaxID=154538 RepID=A0A1M2VNP0_TRAPU|nr:Protein MON2 -like protein [Trametes pubescens]
MGDCINQGVDIQLRILQTLLSLITNFPAVHGQLLGDALLLCFRLQESRIAVVSSTAAATLRQLVMFVVDKVVDEDRRDELTNVDKIEATLPNGATTKLGPSAHDAYAVFEDLCLLANSETPRFLKLDSLRKTFALELIESVLTNYHDLFRKHPELLLLLQHHLCPLVHKSLSDRPNFPLTLRCTRVVFLLLKQFSSELKTESEVFLMLLIRIVGAESSDADPSESAQGHPTRPLWMRVLAMEIMRGLCSDAELMRNVWDRYDAEDGGSKVFTSLISALKRLLTERPQLLGVCQQMFGIGVSAHPSSASTESVYGLDVSGLSGMVASAASATVSGVANMMTTEAGLSVQGSAMKLQCIDQLDKADSPPIPESYLYLLGVQCLVSLCEGFATFTAPLYNSVMVQKPRSAGEPVIRAPPALDLSKLPPDESATKQLRTVHDMVESGWPALLAAISFLISTNLSDELFVDVLASYQALTTVSGMLGLTTPRDAFFTSLARLAIPARVVSSIDSYMPMEPSTPRTAASAISESFGVTLPGTNSQPPGLSERNMACLKVLVSSALFLAGSLSDSWFDILEALQNADYVLTMKGARASTNKRHTIGPGTGSLPPSRSVSTSGQSPQVGSAQQQTTPQSRHPLLADLDPESLQHAIQRLFDATKNLDDDAFRDFVKALCKLSAAMIGMQSEGAELSAGVNESSEELATSAGLSPPVDSAHRRRVSGIHLPRTLRSGDFGVSKLGGVAMLNIHRLIYRSPDVAWDPVTVHLLSVIRHPHAPPTIRTQAARVLDDILVVVPRNISTTGELQPKVQRRVLDVLAQQVIPDSSVSSTTTVEIRRMGLETLHQILQSSGHTLVVGWETIFEMLGSVCKPAPAPSTALTPTATLSPQQELGKNRPPPLGYLNEKGYTSLVKIAFQSLTLVCDSLSSLSPEHLRLCISTLGQFGRQADTNIALTAAESLLWGVSDSIQAKRREEDKEPEYNALWMSLLLEVLGLCTDARPEVRVGAIQTLFRTLQLYGATLSLDTWDECIWKVTFPLLDSITASMRRSSAVASEGEAAGAPDLQWDESKILALQSIGSIFQDFLTMKIMQLDSFTRAWEVFVGHIKDSWLHDNRTITAPALRCLEKAIKSCSAAEELKARTAEALEIAWLACDEMGGVMLEQGPSSPAGKALVADNSDVKPLTQESLMAYVDVVRCTRSIGRQLEDREWSLERLTRLMTILKGVLTYPSSPDFRPDVDALSPVQSVVMEAVDSIELSAPGVASLVLRDLSEYATLPFLAAFDIPPAAPSSTSRAARSGPTRVTYIALSKKVMPLLVDLFLRFKEDAAIYGDGTVEALFAAYSIPIKLKYDCPAPSKFGKDQPLWKTATTSFLRIVKECGSHVRKLQSNIAAEHVEGIWRQVVDTFRGGILADCSAAEHFPLDTQEEEENFDLSLVASLEIDVVPYLGDPSVPDYIVSQLARVLQQGSQLRVADYDLPPSPTSLPDVSSSGKAAEDRFSKDFEKLETFGDGSIGMGTTAPGRFLPRERFSYWCFDLLFLICSDTSQDQILSRRRIAALSIPSLLERCRMTLVSYIADESLRGSLPFPRAREEELLYALRKLLALKLWPGTLWAALSDSPSAYCVEQPNIDQSLPPSDLIADAVKRSTKAHLFHFYPILCEIVAIPRKTPTAWVMSAVPRASATSSLASPNDARHSMSFTDVAKGNADEGHAVEVDARALVKECLKEVGRELGVGH